MKRIALYTISSLCYLMLSTGYLPLMAQGKDVIYLVDETALKGVLTEITGRKVKYISESGQARSADAGEVMMLFSKTGRFIIAPLSALPPEAAQGFINQDSKPGVDIIITLDGQVTPAFIISSSENEVLYEEANKQDGELSMSKDQIAVLIGRGGQHELLVSPSQSAEILFKVKGKVEAINQQTFAQKTPESSEKTSSSKSTKVNKSTADKPAAAATQEVAKAPIKAETVQKNQAPANTTGTTAPALPATGAPEDKPEITEAEQADLKSKALQKVSDFSDYLRVITDATADRKKVEQAVELATALFVDANARIEVSSPDKPGETNRYRVKDYLNRLVLTTGKYDNIKVANANINYAKDFVKGADGKYHGEIKYMQTFRGYENGKALYGDIKKRKLPVIQQPNDKSKADNYLKQWEVLLSDIAVVETKKL